MTNDEIKSLIAECRKRNRFHSNLYFTLEDPAFKQVVLEGEGAILALKELLYEEPSHAVLLALAKIKGRHSVQEEDEGRFSKMIESWKIVLDWESKEPSFKVELIDRKTGKTTETRFFKTWEERESWIEEVITDDIGAMCYSKPGWVLGSSINWPIYDDDE